MFHATERIEHVDDSYSPVETHVALVPPRFRQVLRIFAARRIFKTKTSQSVSRNFSNTFSDTRFKFRKVKERKRSYLFFFMEGTGTDGRGFRRNSVKNSWRRKRGGEEGEYKKFQRSLNSN